MANSQVFKSHAFIIKVVELVLGTLCMSLAASRTVANYPPQKYDVVNATYYGFFFVSAVFVISFILDSPVHPKLVMVMSSVAVVMYIISGALNFDVYFNGYRFPFFDMVMEVDDVEVLIAGIVALGNSVVHAVDVFLSWKQL